jgi:transcriptional regulator of arginine metabolism
MAEKKSRMVRILEIIKEQEIGTQEDLARVLRGEGFDVTQATVSRDIRELGLQKERTQSRGLRYVAPAENDSVLVGRYSRVMEDGIVSLDQAQNILVIKTVSGMAMAVAAALDHMNYPEVVGCIAGDDTIMVATRSMEETQTLMGRIRGLMK